MDTKPYHDLFTASASIFAALWAIFVALAVFMAQQRATTGAKLTFATALTPARAMLANAYFFAGMEISLVQLLPTPDDAVKFWGEVFSLTFAYAPLLMLLVLALIARSNTVWRAFANLAPFYIVASLPLWRLLSASSEHASTVAFTLLGFGCLWTLISVMYLIFYANEWSSAAALGGSPEDLEQIRDTLAETLEALKKRGESQDRQINLLREQNRLLDDALHKLKKT